MVRLAQTVSLVLVLVTPLRVWAWSAGTHREIVWLASQGLPAAWAAEARRFQDELLLGAVAPDRRGTWGWIPPQAHIWEVGERAGPGMEPSVRRLEAWLAEPQRPKDAAWWFQAGRLGHLLGDLCQPLHTASSKRERRMHSEYERWAQELAWAPRPAEATAEAVAELGRVPLAHVAATGRREYAGLVAAFRGAATPRWVVAATQRWRWRSAALVQARLGALLCGEREPRPARGGLRWFALAALWFVLLARRLRE